MTEDLDILETFEEYANNPNVKDKDHRQWGRMSWLYPGELIIQVSGISAGAIREAMKQELEQLHATHDEKETREEKQMGGA